MHAQSGYENQANLTCMGLHTLPLSETKVGAYVILPLPDRFSLRLLFAIRFYYHNILSLIFVIHTDAQNMILHLQNM